VPAVRALPDAELVVTTYLRAHPDVAALVGTRVYTALPSTPTYPLVQVRRFGGIPVIDGHLDRASIQLDIWASSKQQARDTAATVQAALVAMPATPMAGVVVTRVRTEVGLSWQPENEGARPRYTFSAQVTLHNTPA
jgi:hypothetical protein